MSCDVFCVLPLDPRQQLATAELRSSHGINRYPLQADIFHRRYIIPARASTGFRARPQATSSSLALNFLLGVLLETLPVGR